MKFYTLDEIKEAEKYVPQLIEALKKAYIAYSTGKATVPPVGLLHFDVPEGNTYIKYGYLQGDDSFVIKVFNGFPENSKEGLRTGDGFIGVFDAKTGFIKAFLLEQGWLTCLRTAAAAFLTAKYLGPKDIKAIGICGTGTVATEIMELLPYYTDVKNVYVYGNSAKHTEEFVKKYERNGYDIKAADMNTICDNCNLIFTATTSKTPLITASMVKPGTHITGIGADAGGKNEIAADVFKKADMVVVDSCSQCFVDGDTSFALKAGAVKVGDVIELGNLLLEGKGRIDENQITVCDLTGIAVQDIAAAEMVCEILG